MGKHGGESTAYLTSVTAMQAEGEVSIDKKTNPVDWWLAERQGIAHSNSYFFMYMYKNNRKGGIIFQRG